MSQKFLSSLNLLGKATDPATGTAGDLYYNTVLQTVKVYTGTVWTVISGGGSTTVSANAPSNPTEGALWFESDTSKLYVYYNSSWVELGEQGPAGATGAQGPIGLSFTPLSSTGNPISTSLTVGTTNTDFFYSTSNSAFQSGTGMNVQFRDTTAGSTLVYVGTLAALFAGGFGWAYRLSTITEVHGTPVAGTSGNWQLSEVGYKGATGPTGATGANVYTADNAPTGVPEGALWFESDTLKLFIYYLGAWVEVSGGGGGGGSSATYLTKTANYTAAAGDWIFADTKTVGSFTITLPGSPTVGDTVTIVDAKQNFYSKGLTVYSTAKIESKNDTLILNVQNATVVLQYVNSTYGWRIV